MVLVSCSDQRQENFEKAVKLVREENFRDALVILENYNKDSEGSDSSFFYIGVCRFKTGDTRGAIKDFSRAIELNPKYHEAYNIRGLCHGVLGDYDKEMEDYNKSLEIWPDFSKAYYNRGNLKYDRKDLTGALADYSEAIRFQSGYGRAHFNRANVLDELGRFSEALEDYYIALNSFEGEEKGEICFQIALDRLTLGDTVRACQALDSAAKFGYQKAENQKKKLCLKTK